MSQQYETGNAKNVANLQKLIQQVTVYTAYNPSIDNLKIENLNTLYTTALASLTTVEEKRNANKSAIHTRQQAYESLKPTCTRIVNQLDILGLSSGTLDQAKSLNRLVQGTRKKKEETATEENEESKSVSTSRQSYTQLADNFSKILQLLSTIPSYNPNIEELKLATLNTYLTTLTNSTQAVDQTEAELNSKLIERNTILYAEGTGLYTIAQNIKKYVKSVYGASSEEYSKVSKIKFTDK